MMIPFGTTQPPQCPNEFGEGVDNASSAVITPKTRYIPLKLSLFELKKVEVRTGSNMFAQVRKKA
jgi:hypothetical protein